ncbi:MAG: hypothetical protein Q4F57_03635 [Weeksellaceae bacterium]|nr:hypothetical protein [Weeksellaceae bacterium]
MKTQDSYRLRRGKMIVGYAQPSKAGIQFCSKFLLFDKDISQQFTQVDKSIGLLDVRNRPIYEHDMVLYKLNTSRVKHEGVIVYCTEKEVFGIRDLHSNHFTPLSIENLSLFANDRMEIFSHAFMHAPHKRSFFS